MTLDSILAILKDSDYIVSEITEDGEELVSATHLIPNEFKPYMFGSHKYRSNDKCGTIKSSSRCERTGIRTFRHNYCGDAGCPVCYMAVSYRYAERVWKRLEPVYHRTRLYHWSVSFRNIDPLSIDSIRSGFERVYELFRGYGGVVYFHGLRLKKLEMDNGFVGKFWELGPHYHIVTDCPWFDSATIYEDSGKDTVCVQLGYKKHCEDCEKNGVKPCLEPWQCCIGMDAKYQEDLIRVVSYDMSHAWRISKFKTGKSYIRHHKEVDPQNNYDQEIQASFQGIRWFGTMSYANLKVKKFEVEHHSNCHCKGTDDIPGCQNIVWVQNRGRLMEQELLKNESYYELREVTMTNYHHLINKVQARDLDSPVMEKEIFYVYQDLLKFETAEQRQNLTKYLIRIGFCEHIQDIQYQLEFCPLLESKNGQGSKKYQKVSFHPGTEAQVQRYKKNKKEFLDKLHQDGS